MKLRINDIPILIEATKELAKTEVAIKALDGLTPESEADFKHVLDNLRSQLKTIVTF